MHEEVDPTYLDEELPEKLVHKVELLVMVQVILEGCPEKKRRR